MDLDTPEKRSSLLDNMRKSYKVCSTTTILEWNASNTIEGFRGKEASEKTKLYTEIFPSIKCMPKL